MFALEIFAPLLSLETIPTVLLALTLLVVVFGLGVVLIARRKSGSIPSTNSVSISLPNSPTTSSPISHEPQAETTELTLANRMRSSFSNAITSALTRSLIDQQTWDDLEEVLLRADLGVATMTKVLAPLRELVKAKKIVQPRDLQIALRDAMSSQLAVSSRELNFDLSLNAPNIWLIVGVNGVGKTTTIGKLAAQQGKLGRSVLMAAGDTFRAAAADQLETWAERTGAQIVRGNEGGDPSSVVFDGVARATAKNIDLVLADTAGRLQNNTNLMEELTKIRRVADKASGKVTEVLLVIDATTGQNGLSQARQFAQATQVTGVVLTKLDGSAKGGIVFAIETELQIPVKLVGLGESIDDLVAFNPREFVDALFD